MRTMLTAGLAALLLVALAIASGCEDSSSTAGTDYTMGLVATPSTVVIDPPHGIDTANTTIVATVLDASGVPKSGLSVYFSNTGGVLASGTSGVTTNSEGVASTVLTVSSQDDDTITVSATSGTLTEDVEVTKTTAAVNHPPLAKIVATPEGQQGSNKTVLFDGRSSSDSDTGDFISNYKWTITSTNPDDGHPNPIVLQGASVSSVSFPSGTLGAFINVQDLTVVLQVNDTRGASAQVTIPYKIVAVNCNANTRPTAVIAGAATQQLFGAPTSEQDLHLDGGLSSDLETGIDKYTWTCGNGTAPIPQVPPSLAICKYTVDTTSRTYTATLVVTDKGTGVLDDSTGEYQCAASSVPASVQVTVSPSGGSAR